MSDLFEFVLAWLIFGMAAVLTWRAWKRESAPPHLDFIQKIKWWVVDKFFINFFISALLVAIVVLPLNWGYSKIFDDNKKSITSENKRESKKIVKSKKADDDLDIEIDDIFSDKTNGSQNNSVNSSPTNTPAPQLGREWIQDINTGIYLKNPEPTDGESITWSGGYVQDGQYKLANGYGVTNWYRYGELKQVDEGTFIKGERNGQFKHKFYPSGNVDYSNWDRGVEILGNVGQNDRWIIDFGMYSYYAITDSYIDHGDRGAEIDVKLLDQDGGAFIGIEHYSFNQTNDPRGFRFSTSSGQTGWMIEDRIAKPVFDYIAHYLHKGTS